MSCTAVPFAEASESIVFLPLIPTSRDLPHNHSTSQPTPQLLNLSTTVNHSTPPPASQAKGCLPCPQYLPASLMFGMPGRASATMHVR